MARSQSPYLISLRERNDWEKKNGPKGRLSGAEPKYEPGRWNNNERIKRNHNCYAYVLNKIASKRSGKPQPGYFSGFPAMRSGEYRCEEFYKRLKKDVPGLYKVSFETPCRRGFYKGFIAIDPKEEDQDYHFYRQDRSGRWSHKPGRGEATNLDASGNEIENPAEADRKYKYFDYSEPCFFFCLNSSLARTRS